MPVRKFFATSRIRVSVLLLILSLILAACDTLANPETEDDITFEGAPEVTIASPLNGDTYQEGVGVNILLRVDNAGPDIARIAVEVDGTIIGEAISPNPNGDPSFTVNNGWPAMGEGQHVISAIASRSDGTVSEEASVTINVIANEMPTEEATDIPLPTDAPADDDTNTETDTSDDDTSAPAPTQAPVIQSTSTPVPPSPVPATNTPSRPQVVVVSGANVRSGPGTVFEPPVGSLAAGERRNILAVNNAGTWYRIEFGLSDAWISDIVVDVEGSLTGLPREAGPPTPVPPSPVPPTNTPVPSSNVDLFIDEAQSSFVPTFRCAQPTTINITVVNGGSERSQGVRILIEDVQPDGTVGESTETVVGALDPNASQTVQAVMTVSTFINEVHTFRARVDIDNVVAETNENNNTWDEIYTLEPGNC
ncbi:MAG: CARDB domain-containing protein [Chloroflexota bacterium]